MDKSKYITEYIEDARLAARFSKCFRANVGAVLVKDSKAVAYGYNAPPPGHSICVHPNNADNQDDYLVCQRIKNSIPRLQGYNMCKAVHAEINCLSMAALQGIPTVNTDLFITRAPCSTCLRAVISFGVSRIYFTPRAGTWMFEDPVCNNIIEAVGGDVDIHDLDIGLVVEVKISPFGGRA